MDALARLAAHAHGVVGGDGEVFLDLFPHALGLCGGQVDLVDGRHDVEVCVHGQKRIADRLGLDALGGVDYQHGTLAGGKRARDLVGEVNVTRRVDEVELVGVPIVGIIGHADGIALDGNAALALDVHAVEHLRLKVTLLDGVGQLENSIADGGLAVVDVRNDGEVADM